MEISSFHSLKKFVNERLSAAAEEIFGVFEKTLSVYEEEILRQRELLQTQRTGPPEPPYVKEGGVLDESQFHHQGTTNLDQDDTKPPLIKEEQQEFCTSPEEEQFVSQQESKAFKLSPAYDVSDCNEEQTLLVEEEPQSSFSDVTEPTSNPDQHVQTDNIQYICVTCGKSFRVSTDLILHMKSHTGEKPYRCKYCQKEFSSSSSVSRHLRVHTGEKPYECSLCGKRFNVSTTLRVHYRIHTGEKPYKCQSCDKAFTTCSNLKKHMVLHTKGGNRHARGLQNVPKATVN